MFLVVSLMGLLFDQRGLWDIFQRKGYDFLPPVVISVPHSNILEVHGAHGRLEA
jgi:hypothetical protein